MAGVDRYNVIKMVEEALLRNLKASVIDSLVDQMVSEFRDKAEQEVKMEVEKLSVLGVESFRDMAEMRDEVKVYCEWKEG